MRNRRSVGIVVVALALACIPRPKGVETNPASKTQQAPREEFDDKISDNAKDSSSGGGRPSARTRSAARSSGAASCSFTRHPRAEAGRRRRGPDAEPGAQGRPQGRRRRVPKLLVEVMREGSVTFDSPETTLELLRADAVVGVPRYLRQGQEPHLGRHHLRPLPFDRRRLVHEGHRPPARRLAEPRPERRRDRRAWRPICSAFTDLLQRRRGDGAQGAVAPGARGATTRS